LKYPTKHGVVEDWQSMVHLWEHVYKEADIISQDHPVLLTEPPLNPYQNQNKMAEKFFERFNVPALFVAQQAILSLYASGRETGLVLDSGHGVTHCVPVFEGFALNHAITRMDVAGADVTEYLNLLLRKSGVNFHTSSEMETVRLIKEKKCRVRVTGPASASDSLEDEPVTNYQLPDGRQIKIRSEKWRAPEVLFDPSLIGLEYAGIPRLIDNSIMRCDMDLRRELYSNIMLSGGSTTFPGFGDRLLYELKYLAQEKHQDIKIRIYAPTERRTSTWTGGSILATLNNFRSQWITRRDYTEYGPSILRRQGQLLMN